jgi:hypothetical protein
MRVQEISMSETELILQMLEMVKAAGEGGATLFIVWMVLDKVFLPLLVSGVVLGLGRLVYKLIVGNADEELLKRLRFRLEIPGSGPLADHERIEIERRVMRLIKDAEK